MIRPLARPRRKNPMLRTRLPLLPPGGRSRARSGAHGRRSTRPIRAAGVRRVRRSSVSSPRSLPSLPFRRASLARAERARRAPVGDTWYITATIPSSASACPGASDSCAWMRVRAWSRICTAAARPRPARVRVGARLDKSGQGVLLAFPLDEVPNMADDPELREMTCDPKFRKVLVTDGMTAVGRALVRALVEAGADLVWVGHAEPWKHSCGPRRARGAAAGGARAARPDRFALGEGGRRRNRRQSRHPDQHRRGAPRPGDRLAQRRGVGARGNGRQLLRAPAARAGIRAGHARTRRGRHLERDGVGQPPVDLRARELSAARNLFRLQGGRALALAMPARRDAAGRHPGHQCVSGSDRR